MAPPFGDRCRNTLCDLGPSGSPYSTRHRRDRCMILPFRSSVHRRGDHFTLRLPAKREYGTQTNISTHTIPRFFVSFVWPNGYFCWGPRTQVERQVSQSATFAITSSLLRQGAKDAGCCPEPTPSLPRSLLSKWRYLLSTSDPAPAVLSRSSTKAVVCRCLFS